MTYVDQPLTAQLVQFLQIRQIHSCYFRGLQGMYELLASQSFVMWHFKMLDLVASESEHKTYGYTSNYLFVTADHISEVVKSAM